MIEKKEYLLKGLEDSMELAQKIANALKASGVLALYGDLGSGKTFFCQEIIRTLANNPMLNVISPTFNLLQSYEMQDYTVYHYDLYRLNDISDTDELGIEDAFSEKNICLIEWPEIIETILPKNSMHIRLKIIENDQRSCIIQ